MLYCDVSINGVPLFTGVPCLNAVPLSPAPYLGLGGQLAFVDTQGVEDPDYTGIGPGGRFMLLYSADGLGDDPVQIPLQPIPSQQLDVALGVQNCTISIYTRVSVAPTVPPGPVLDLVAVPGNTVVDLSWDAPLNAFATGVFEYLITGPGLNVTQAGTTLHVTGLTNGTPYAFTVTAVGFTGAGIPASITVTPDAPPVLVSLSMTYGLDGGNQPVVLTGTGFQAGATVLFGSTAATVGAITSTTIHVTTPAHADATVAVTVTNPDTQVTTLASAFTFGLTVIPDDANTKIHFYVKGAAANDTAGHGWVASGSLVPFHASAPLTGFANGAYAESAGGFDDTHFFVFQNTGDEATMDSLIDGDFIITLLLCGSGNSSTVPFAKSGSPVDNTGFEFELVKVGGGAGWYFANPTTTWFVQDTHIPSDTTTPHVISFGRTGTTYFMKVDNNTVQTGTLGGTLVHADEGNAATWLGRWVPSGTAAYNANIYEVRCTTTTPSTAVLNALHAAITG